MKKWRFLIFAIILSDHSSESSAGDCHPGKIVAYNDKAFYELDTIEHHYLYGRVVDVVGEDVTLQYSDRSRENTSPFYLRATKWGEKIFFNSKVHPFERYDWENIILPNEFLQSVGMGVDFAIRSGAAREIGAMDLDHFHVLLCPDFKGKTIYSALRNQKGILLHSQEHTNYGPENYKKRNILVTNGKVSSILPKDGGITVFPEELGFQEESMWMQGYIVDLADLDTRRLKMPTHNIIRVGSKKLYIGFARSP